MIIGQADNWSIINNKHPYRQNHSFYFTSQSVLSPLFFPKIKYLIDMDEPI